MENNLLELGMGGLVAILVIREVLGFIKTKRNDNREKEITEYKKLLHIIADEVKWLKDVHNQKDRDGVYAWYVRQSLEEAVEKLGENIAMQTRVFESLVIKIDMMTNK